MILSKDGELLVDGFSIGAGGVLTILLKNNNTAHLIIIQIIYILADLTSQMWNRGFKYQLFLVSQIIFSSPSPERYLLLLIKS